jgi:hypothetical protein
MKLYEWLIENGLRVIFYSIYAVFISLAFIYLFIKSLWRIIDCIWLGAVAWNLESIRNMITYSFKKTWVEFWFPIGEDTGE